MYNSLTCNEFSNVWSLKFAILNINEPDSFVQLKSLPMLSCIFCKDEHILRIHQCPGKTYHGETFADLI